MKILNVHLPIEFDKKLNSCVPKGKVVYAYPFFVGNNKSDDSNNNQQPSNGQNGQQTSNGQNGNTNL